VSKNRNLRDWWLFRGCGLWQKDESS